MKKHFVVLIDKYGNAQKVSLPVILLRDIKKHSNFSASDIDYIESMGMPITLKSFCDYVNWMFNTDLKLEKSRWIRKQFEKIHRRFLCGYAN